MPAQVVVVRRTRRSLFAAPRALPDWLRSLWATVSLKAPPRDGSSREEGVEPTRLSIPAPRLPRLVRDRGSENAAEIAPSHRCVGCHVCARVCPSRCLTIETEDGTRAQAGDATVLLRFELESGACIGCGLCVEACPESALEMELGPRVDVAAVSGRPIKADLLSRVGADARAFPRDAR